MSCWCINSKNKIQTQSLTSYPLLSQEPPEHRDGAHSSSDDQWPCLSAISVHTGCKQRLSLWSSLIQNVSLPFLALLPHGQGTLRGTLPSSRIWGWCWAADSEGVHQGHTVLGSGCSGFSFPWASPLFASLMVLFMECQHVSFFN